MIKRGKKAQTVFGLSYGMIFSIFIIIFVIVAAFLAIRHFLGLNECTQVGFLYEDLNKEVERAWSSGPGRYSEEFTHSVQKEIEYVCFGSLTGTPDAADPMNAVIQQNITRFRNYNDNHNVFIYPPQSACEGSMFSYDLKCGTRDSNCLTTSDNLFFCAKVDDREIKLRLEKNSADSRITVSAI